ncbi:MAG TPA: ferredoxin reductase [Jatrophihabitans sp.]|nr:ferredoxin reductase [Jatrophihabitans sp.]
MVEAAQETATARTLRFRVPEWPGHLPGQHVDVRLTAEDGYTAQRSYSLSAPAAEDVIEMSVQLVADGEVSPYLVSDIAVGDTVEVRGPLGGWFVWRTTQSEPVLLIGGGSGIAPLMAMVRARRAADTGGAFRLLYSVRTPADVFYADELHDSHGVEVAVLYTRAAAEGVARPAHRIDADDLTAHGWPVVAEVTCYVCGPTPFVEAIADQLVQAGHDPAHIRTERFGASGG